MVEVASQRRPDLHRNGLHLSSYLSDDANSACLSELRRAAGNADRFERIYVASGGKGAGAPHLANYGELIAVRILHGHRHLRDGVTILRPEAGSDDPFQVGRQETRRHHLAHEREAEGPVWKHSNASLKPLVAPDHDLQIVS